MKNTSIFALMLASLFAGDIHSYHKNDIAFRSNRARRKKGAGKGGFHPPTHARARRWKKVFGGLCVPRIDSTQFHHE